MSIRTASYLEAVEHLPANAVLVIEDVTWSDYAQLLVDLESWPGMRISYNRGRLEIVSPSRKHEKIKMFVDHLVAIFCEEKSLPMENLGSSTFKRERDEQGAEPDVCFYVNNLDVILTQDDMDANPDPPPDVVVEIDISNDSKTKFEIYAGFRVPEIWIYKREHVRIYQLAGNEYVEAEASRFFSGLTAGVLTNFVNQSVKLGRTPVLAAFRQWLQDSLT